MEFTPRDHVEVQVSPGLDFSRLPEYCDSKNGNGGLCASVWNQDLRNMPRIVSTS